MEVLCSFGLLGFPHKPRFFAVLLLVLLDVPGDVCGVQPAVFL
jgi:hypothetical protein